MSFSKLRSTSTNSRLKINQRLDTSVVLSNAQNSLLDSSSKSKEKLPIKLPRLTPSSRESVDTSISQDFNEENIVSLKKSLQLEWDKKSVPKDLQKVFNDKVWSLPRHKAAAIASRELDDLRKNRSAMMTALRAVISREESLNSVYEMEKFLKQVPNWEKLRDVQLECAELLHAHRILTINAVETIEKWREMIRFSALVNNETGSVHIPFMYNEVNYLIKMRNDLDFLVDSEFRKVFSFDKTDPLLIKPSVPAIKIKEKKIDSNYFIQHGQVVVSLPSSLRLKVDMANDVMSLELKFQNKLDPKHVEDISNVIFEELCEEEVTNDAVFFFGNNKSAVLGPLSEMLADGLVDELCKGLVLEVKQEKNKEMNEKLANEMMERMIEKEIEASLKQIVGLEVKGLEKERKDSVIKEQRLKEETENLARAIYNDLFGSLMYGVSAELLETAKKDSKELEDKVKIAKTAKENSQIAEKIRDAYVEEEVQRVTVELGNQVQSEKDSKKYSDALYSELIAQMLKEVASETYSELKSQHDSKVSKSLNDISEQVLNSLIDQLLPDLSLIAKEAFEYEIQLYSDRSELLDNVGFGFMTEEGWEEPGGFIFKQISAPDSVFPKIIEEYFPKIPDEELCVTADQEFLEEETEKLDAHYYWGLKAGIIVGLLVFSVDFDRNDVRVINVHHLTCLNWKYYPSFIDQATKFIWDSDHCEETRVNLYIPGNPEIPGHIKKVFNALQFRWKTNLFNEDEEISIVVMGKLRPQIKLQPLAQKKQSRRK